MRVHCRNKADAPDWRRVWLVNAKVVVMGGSSLKLASNPGSIDIPAKLCTTLNKGLDMTKKTIRCPKKRTIYFVYFGVFKQNNQKNTNWFGSEHDPSFWHLGLDSFRLLLALNHWNIFPHFNGWISSPDNGAERVLFLLNFKTLVMAK